MVSSIGFVNHGVISFALSSRRAGSPEIGRGLNPENPNFGAVTFEEFNYLSISSSIDKALAPEEVERAYGSG